MLVTRSVVLSFFFIAILIPGCFTLGCSEKVDKAHLSEYLSDYQDIVGRKIVFDTTILKQSFPLAKVSFANNKKKIIGLIGTSCISCFEYIKQWNKFLQEGKFTGVPIYLIALGTSTQELKYYVENENKAGIPLLLDENGEFITTNKLFKYNRATLLLNEENRVIFVGNPMESEQILNFYNYYIH